MTATGRHPRGDRRLLASIRAIQHLQDGPVSSSASNPSPAPQPTGTGADDNTGPGCGDTIERARELLRANVGDAYNLLTQGESPTQRRGPSAQRIYDRNREALAELDAALAAAHDAGCGEPAPYPPHGAAGSPEPNTERERPAPRDPWTGSRRGAGQEGTIPMTDNNAEKLALADVLREVASFLDSLPIDAALTTATIGLHGLSKDQLAAFARHAGKATKHGGEATFWLERRFPMDVCVAAFARSRAEVCERRVIDVVEVPEQTIPAHTREIVEWECAPILADDGQANR